MIVIFRQSVRNMSRVFSLTGIFLSSFVNISSITYLGYMKSYLSIIGNGGAILSFAMYIYVHGTRFNELVVAVPYICYNLTLIAGYFTFIVMRNKMDYFLQRINENIFTYTRECQIHVKYSWLCSETNTQVIHFCVFLSQFIGLPACFIPPLFDHFVLHKTKSLSYPGWTPWDPEEYFVATFSVQLVLGLSFFWLMFFIKFFIVFATIEFSRQNTRLCAALASIHLRTEQKVMERTMHMSGDRNKPNERMMKNLLASEFENNIKQCIRHHQMIMKLFRIFESWFKILFQCELLGASLTFAVAFYNLFQTSHEVAYMGLITSSCIFIVSLFTSCIVGEIFSDMNEKIALVIFHEVRWYEQSLSNVRLLSIFHSQVRRPMDLFAFSIFKASFSTFKSVMRTSYSYLNVLKVSSSKN